MNYFLKLIEKHKFLYIVSLSVVVTVLLVNNTLDFAERVINNKLLLIISLVVFYFLVQIAINEEVKNEKRAG